MSLHPGVYLGPYELLAEIGSGGMGVVYKARDSRLERIVAIKVLPPDKLQDSDSSRRFNHEARAASALNHPNIVTIYDIATDAGHDLIVMEYIDGRTLQEVISDRHTTVLAMLRLAIQVADALAAAHAAGIVHRDLKPGNIMVTAPGQVKVLDFGLAKLVNTGIGTAAKNSDASTIYQPPKTVEGAIVGSVPYMSPEQAEGRPVDARSDIFSFGTVLYEMLTGRRAFQGGTPLSTLALILDKDPPPITEIRPTLPRELGQIISRCLRKDVVRRSQHISDVSLALEEVREDLESGAPSLPARPAPRRWHWQFAAAALCVLAACVVAWEVTHRSPKEPSHSELIRLSPDDDFTYTDPVISPDGKFVAYASDRGGSTQLWLQQIAGGEPIQLTHEANGASEPMFSPDGSRLAYAGGTRGGTSTGIYLVPTLGGTPREVVRENASLPRFSPDGQSLVYLRSHSYSDDDSPRTRYMVVPAAGGSPKELNTDQIDISRYSPALWADDRRILLMAQDPLAKEPDWFIVPVDGGRPTSMGATTVLKKAGLRVGPAQTLDRNRAIFSSSSHIWDVPISRSSWKVTGAPRQLTFGTEPESTNFVTSTQLAAIGFTRSKSDLWFLPLDVNSGRISGAARRVTQDGRQKRFLGFPGPSNWFLMILPRPEGGGLDSVLHNMDTGREMLFPREVPRISVSPDGRRALISQGVRGQNHVVLRSLAEADPSPADRIMCQQCSPMEFLSGSQALIYYSDEAEKNESKRKPHVTLMDLDTSKELPWLSGTLTGSGLFGQHSDWIYVSLFRGTGTRRYLIPFRRQPPPETEWVEVDPKIHFHVTAGSNLGYYSDKGLMAARFDPVTRRFADQSFRIVFPAGSQPFPRPGEAWDLNAAGIAFQHSTTTGSIWLLKVPE